MTYFNYHAKAKRLLKDGHCMSVSVFKSYHNIKPALVLYFDNNFPMPIRNYMWNEYLPLIREQEISISNPDHIDLE